MDDPHGTPESIRVRDGCQPNAYSRKDTFRSSSLYTIRPDSTVRSGICGVEAMAIARFRISSQVMADSSPHAAPHAARHLDDQAQLSLFLVHGDRMARYCAGKSALGADRHRQARGRAAW